MPFVINLLENKIYQARYERGVAVGEARGEAKILSGLLKKRFGRLPVWARKRLEEAEPEQLEAWSLQVLDAKKLDDVIGKR